MWEIGVSNQVFTFLLSILLGFVFCILYDFLRSIRKAGFNSYIATLITDIIYWVIIAFVTFLFLLARTNGEIRGYVLISALLGFIAFRLTLSKLLFGTLCFVMRFTVKVVRFIHNAFYRFFDEISNRFTVVLVKIIKSLRLTLKKLKKLLKYRYSMLYTKANSKTSRNGDG